MRRWEERAKMQKKLDADLQWFRTAAKRTPARKGWLREIRLALDVPSAELAAKLEISRSEIFREEQREQSGRITLAVLQRLAEAMECRLVYAVISKKGTLEQLSNKRMYECLFGEDGEKKFKAMLRRGRLEI